MYESRYFNIKKDSYFNIQKGYIKIRMIIYNNKIKDNMHTKCFFIERDARHPLFFHISKNYL